jgi:hypothetical protein
LAGTRGSCGKNVSPLLDIVIFWKYLLAQFGRLDSDSFWFWLRMPVRK